MTETDVPQFIQSADQVNERPCLRCGNFVNDHKRQYCASCKALNFDLLTHLNHETLNAEEWIDWCAQYVLSNPISDELKARLDHKAAWSIGAILSLLGAIPAYVLFSHAGLVIFGLLWFFATVTIGTIVMNGVALETTRYLIHAQSGTPANSFKARSVASSVVLTTLTLLSLVAYSPFLLIGLGVAYLLRLLLANWVADIPDLIWLGVIGGFFMPSMRIIDGFGTICLNLEHTLRPEQSALTSFIRSFRMFPKHRQRVRDTLKIVRSTAKFLRTNKIAGESFPRGEGKHQVVREMIALATYLQICTLEGRLPGKLAAELATRELEPDS